MWCPRLTFLSSPNWWPAKVASEPEVGLRSQLPPVGQENQANSSDSSVIWTPHIAFFCAAFWLSILSIQVITHCRWSPRSLPVFPAGDIPSYSCSSFTSQHLLTRHVQNLSSLWCLALQPAWSYDDLWSQCDHHLPVLSLLVSCQPLWSRETIVGAQPGRLCQAGSGIERSGRRRPMCPWGIPTSLLLLWVLCCFPFGRGMRCGAVTNRSPCWGTRMSSTLTHCDAGLPFPSCKETH